MDMANLQIILQELREFRRENAETLQDILKAIKATNSRVDEAELRISDFRKECRGRPSWKITDQEGRARQENISIHGIEEGSESNSTLTITFVEKLLREKMETLWKRLEYAEAKNVLRENIIRFQTPFAARMRVFYGGVGHACTTRQRRL